MVQKNRTEYFKKYHRKHKRIMRKQRKEYLKTVAGRFAQGKGSSKARELEWSISLEDYSLLLNQSCYYCGRKLATIKGVSLDRIDNQKGYSKDNVLPSCGICNIIRSNILTVAETKVAMEAILKFRKYKRLSIKYFQKRNINLG